MKSSRCIALLLLLVVTGGCFGLGGTETGNPVIPPVIPSDFPTGTQAGSILDTICTKLTQCNAALPFNACEKGILPISTIDTEIGLDAGVYTDYRAIIEAENRDEITPDVGNAAACRTEIASLLCTDAEVQNAFDPDQPSEFDSVDNMFSANTPSCATIF
jgi:hypothetical protein